jgi:PBP1b-binding outer membrane lipoprotein LpoB
MRKTLLLGALILSGCMAGEITTSRVDNKTIAVGVTKIDDNTYDVNAKLDDPFQSIDRISDFVNKRIQWHHDLGNCLSTMFR